MANISIMEALVVPSAGKTAEFTPVVLSAIQPTEALVEIHATGIWQN